MKLILFVFIYLLTTVSLNGQDSSHFAKPFFISTEINRVKINSIYHYQFEAKDSAGMSLSYSVKDLPSWLTCNLAEHTISGNAVKAGQYPIHIETTNGHSSAGENFMLTVYDKQTTNILCLGNSITNGTNKFNSYRRALWQMLQKEGFNVDFIGSWNKHHMGGDVPDPDFDMDHEGHSGWRFDDMLRPPSWDSARGNMSGWLKTYSPDIVLLELGTNDVFQCRTNEEMLKDLSVLVGLLRKRNSAIKIFIAQIPPLGKQWASKKLCGGEIDYDHAIKSLNKAFVLYASSHQEKRSPIIVVDQYSGIDTDTEMYDDIHPNESGEYKMAGKWFKAIRPYLNKLK